MKSYLSIFSGILVLCNVLRHGNTQWYKTVYQRVQQESEFKGFNKLIHSNRVAKLNLHYQQLTVFVPENRVFRKYDKDFHPDLAFYHMSFDVVTLEDLNTTNSINTVILENPPLWITRFRGDVYVNNAKIIQGKSNYLARSRTGDMGKEQILHMIDDVLDPMITAPKYSPSAYDFLSSTQNWDLTATKTVTNFFTKIQETKLQYAFQQQAGHTFFIPLDSGIDPHKFKLISKALILGHIIPYYVLFTRPTEKNFAYESLANDDYVYIVLSLEERDDKMYVKGSARGNLGDGDSQGEFYSEIIVANIPVKNGVVHLISQPLGIFTRSLKPFPYLPIIEKLSNDPTIGVFYDMGENTGFNGIFDTPNATFTYFVPKDSSWSKAEAEGLLPLGRNITILRRHLIISETPYSIEQLFSMTKANNYTDIELLSQGGILGIMVLRIEGDYYVKWNNKYIRVIRANYECTNGIVHILEGPLVNFRKTSDNEDVVEEPVLNFDNYWTTLKHAWSNAL